MTSIRGNGYVEFRFYRPEANDVQLVGDFTGWKRRPLRMKSDGDGWWQVVLYLGAGEYRFRYVADGEWYTDYAAYGVELDDGNWNSVLRVPYLGRDQEVPMANRLAA